MSSPKLTKKNELSDAARNIAAASIVFVLASFSACVSKNDEPPKVTAAVSVNQLTEIVYDLTEATLNIKGQLRIGGATPLTSVQFFGNSTCNGTPIGAGLKSDFESSGIQLVVSSSSSTDLYVKTNISGSCHFAIRYNPTHAAPPPPVYQTISPASPSRLSFTPVIFGTVSPSTVSVSFYTDSACTILIGSGTASDYASSGIQLSLAPDTNNSIYGKAIEPFGNGSTCQLLTTYIHSTLGPAAPIFSSISPPSPSRTSTLPQVVGLTSASVTLVEIYLDTACTFLVASGTRAEFAGAGIVTPIPENTTSTLYAVALDALERPSTCAYLTSYTHDSIAPRAPTFTSISPGLRTRITQYPVVKGTADGESATVRLYNGSTCSILIGSGTKAQFEGAGITASASPNDVTAIHAQTVDAAGNASPCTSLVSFTHDTLPPDPPLFSATTPLSPNNQSTTPQVQGGAPIDAVQVKLFSNDTCTTEVGNGTGSEYNNTGITATLPDNATTPLYGQTIDDVGNASDCTFLANYAHSTTPAPAPAFSQSLPASPSRISTTPYIRGTAPSSVTRVYLYTDNVCTYPIGNGTRSLFITGGVQVTVSARSNTPIHAKSVDVYGNDSPCTYLTDYIHEDRPLPDPTFASTDPVSPNNTSSTPMIRGTAPSNPLSLLTASTLSIYDSSICANLLGTGSAANFPNPGIQINVPMDAITSLYARSFDAAGNQSNCAYLTDYTHDSLQPGRPQFGSASPASPSFTAVTQIKGTFAASPDFLPVTTVTIYSNNTCTTSIGAGSPATFTSSGISVTAPANAVTALYGDSVNAVGTRSACNFLTNYRHRDVSPANLSAVVQSSGAVNVSWNPDLISSPTPTYTLKRSTKSGGPYTIIAKSISGTSFVDTSVKQNATYHYVVQAANSTGTSQDSTQVTASIAVGGTSTPSSLTAVPGPSDVTLSWSGFASSLFYKVYRSTQRGGPYSLIATDVRALGYRDTTVTDSIAYYYVVSGSNPQGETIQSNEASTVPLAVSGAPTNLTVLPLGPTPLCGGSSGALLRWSAPSYFNQFVVNRGGSPGVTSSVATVSSTSYVDCNPLLDLVDNSNYYSIAALWGSFQSPPSNEEIFHHVSGPSVAANAGNNSVVLAWSPVAGASTYRILRSSRPRGPYTLLDGAYSGSNYSDTTVSNGQGYFYVVYPVFATNGLGHPSQEVSAIPGPNPPAPTNLVVTVNSSGRPVLDWNPPTHYNSFNIYRAAAAGGPWNVLATVNTTNYTDGSVPTGRSYYRVTALWSSFETATSNTVSFRNGVTPSLTATSNTGNVALSWTAVGGASNYTIKRSTASGGPYSTIAAANVATSYTDSAITANTGYFYVVSTNFPDGTSSINSQEASAMPGAGTVPSGLTVVSTSSNSVSLTWARVKNATSYRLYRSPTLGGTYTLVQTNISTLPVLNPSLSPLTTYYYKVTAVVGSESAQSAAIAAYTGSTPAAPSGSPGDESIDLTWTPASGATSYSVGRSTDGSNFTTIASGISTLNHTDTGLTNGTVYFYRVTATFPGGNFTGPSSVGIAPGGAPSVPTALNVMGNSTGMDLTLGWASVAGATRYNVYMSTTSGGPYGSAMLSTSSTTGNVISSLTPGTTYYFTVAALKGTLESAMSSELVAIPLGTPAAPTAIAASTPVVNLSWSAVAAATSYNIYRSRDGETFNLLASGVAATTYSDPTVSGGQSYSYYYLPLSGSIEMAPSARSAAVTPVTQPQVPASLAASTSGANSIVLRWVESPNVASYNIYRGSGSGGPYTLLLNLSAPATNYTDNTVSSPNSYFYVISAVNTSGVESGLSNEVGIDLSSTPGNLVATAGSQTISLTWDSVAGANSYRLRRSTVSGGPYGLISNAAPTSYVDSNIRNGILYYYVVEAVFAGGTISAKSAETFAVASRNMDLQVPIELTDQGIASDTTSVTFETTQTTLMPSAYDGTVTWHFEAVATNLDSVPRSIQLVDSAGVAVASLPVSSGTTDPLRLRTTFTPNASTDTYRLRLPATGSGNDLLVHSAKVIVDQVGATRTKLYVPLLSSFGIPNSSDVLSPVAITASTSYASLPSASIYTRDTTTLSTLDDYTPWELETVTSVTGASTGLVSLVNRTRNAVVQDTETIFSSPAPTLVNSPFREGTLNFQQSNNNDRYEISIACNTGCSSGQAQIHKAGLWVTLTQLRKARIFHRVGLGVNTASATPDAARAMIDLTRFTSPVVSFQVTAAAPNSGSASVDLAISGADSGTGGLSYVTGASLGYGSTAKSVQRTGPVTLVSGDRYLPVINAAGGNAQVTDAFIVIDVSR